MNNIQITLAIRYLWGRKLRTFLTTLAIIFGAMIVFMMNIILPTMMEAFQVNMLAASGQVDLTITHVTGEAFSRKSLAQLRALDGVRAVSGTLSRTVNIPSEYYPGEEVSALTLTGIEPKAATALRPYLVKEGRFLRAGDERMAVISTSLAETLNLQLGQRLYLPTAEGNVTLKIIGLLPRRTMPGNEEVLVTLREAQGFFDSPGRINTIEINLDSLDNQRRAATQTAIEAMLGEDYTLGGLSSGAEMLASLQTGQMVMNLFGFLAFFMGGFIIFNTFRTIVAERRRDIGMLRSLGAGRGTIVWLILIEGLFQGLIGTLIGIGLGYLLGAVATQALSPMLNNFMHIDIGAPVIEPGLVLLTISLGIGVTLLAGLLPAINAGNLTPLEALRPINTASEKLKAGLNTVLGIAMLVLALAGLFSGQMALVVVGGLLFLIGLVLIGPLVVRPFARMFGILAAILFARDGVGDLAQSNLTRQPSRSAITASATMIGLAVIVGMGSLVYSLTGGFMGMLQRSLGSDYLLMPPSVGVWKSNIGAGTDLAERVNNIPGVAVVSSMRFAAANAKGKPISLLGIDPVSFPQVAGLTFQEGNEASAYAALQDERAIIINGITASQLEVMVGDSIRLSTANGPQMYRVVAIAGDYINAKMMTAYTSQEYLYRDFRKREDIFIQVNLSEGADQDRVEARLNDLLEDYPQFSLVSGKGFYEENKQLFDSILIFYVLLLYVLAFPSLIAMLNTLAIGVIERTREIGMLRAIGATRSQVRRTVITESLLLAAIGTAFGLLAGLYLGYAFVLGLSAIGFPVEYEFPYVGLIAAIAIGLIFGVLAALFPARQAAKMNIIRALRFE